MIKSLNYERFIVLTSATVAAVLIAAGAPGFAKESKRFQVATSRHAASEFPSCDSAAFLTFEQGRLTSVDWVDRTANKLHTRVMETQSHTVDATIELTSDETAIGSSVRISTAGDEGKPNVIERNLGEGAVYWSPRIPSSIEQAIRRARVLDKPSSKIPGASLFSDSRPQITVERIDSTDWVVIYNPNRYLVLTDDRGCMLSATLPDFGVIIERRTNFSPTDYPAWPPYSAPPDGAYRAFNVDIHAPQGHVLAGTLTLPAHRNKMAAAVLITGLSPHERNNGDAPWMPFRDVADALSRSGVAVLRVDDRGIGKSTGDNKSLTTSDKAEDVRTEVAWLRKRSDIDAKRVMLVGYSEGGLIGPMVAAKDHLIAALITLAGPGVPGMEVARYQVEQPILRDPKMSEAERQTALENGMAEALKDLTPHESSFLATDPIQFDRLVRCPALIIQGGADATIPLRSAERIAWAMRGGGNADVTLRIFPGISHSLLPDPGGLPSGWGGLPGYLTAPELLEALTRWSVAKLRLNESQYSH